MGNSQDKRTRQIAISPTLYARLLKSKSPKLVHLRRAAGIKEDGQEQ